MKPHKRKGRAALRKRQQRAAGKLVPVSYEEAYQMTQGFRYRQNDLFDAMIEGKPFRV